MTPSVSCPLLLSYLQQKIGLFNSSTMSYRRENSVSLETVSESITEIMRFWLVLCLLPFFFSHAVYFLFPIVSGAKNMLNLSLLMAESLLIIYKKVRIFFF